MSQTPGTRGDLLRASAEGLPAVGGSARSPAMVVEHAVPPLPRALMDAESRFYRRRAWCLDAFPTVAEAIGRLREEISSLEGAQERWQIKEALVNVFLLSCAVADAVDDHLAGEGYDFSRVAAVVPVLRPLASAVERVLAVAGRRRARRLAGLQAWRCAWDAALQRFLQAWMAAGEHGAAAPAVGPAELAALLGREMPAELGARRTKVPAAFRTQDLTHHDVVEMAARFATAFPDRRRAILVVGLRTAGSYFAPLVRASLARGGYGDVTAVTLRPKKGIAPREQAAIARCGARGGLAIVVDEPAFTGNTLTRTVDGLRRAGVAGGDIVILMPVHPTWRDWNRGYECLPLASTAAVTLEPEAWHKRRRLEMESVGPQVEEYFRARGYAATTLVASPSAERFNRRLQHFSEEKFHTRLKRVYEVRLRDHEGRPETRYVLAKSVGWGWLGYHAFLAAEALADFVPPVLGLREGVLYTEWLPQKEPVSIPADRAALVGRAASYVAARVRSLRLESDPGPHLDARNQKGLELLATALSGAYGLKPVAVVKRADLRRELSRRPCAVPTLIDGKMRPQEWIRSGETLLKTDFEQHGLGKTELNVTDPAYDLAEAVLHFGLSPAEEEALLQRYRSASGDEGVEQRLFVHKLLAGTAALSAALNNLKDPRLIHIHPEFNRSYIEARDFLTAHMARFSGGLCRVAPPIGWRSPLVVMDVDGVLDKEIFGFPSTTAAGVESVSLLHAHGAAVALNTARTLGEVREYCRSYGCVGGAAEYGSVVWDAVTDRKHVLVTPESHAELQRLAEALRHVPGVFLNDRYEHSLRAYTYDGGRTVPLPTALAQGALARLGLSRLTVHQTFRDTTVLAREVDKGEGLLALLRLAGHEDLDTVAIGDSEPDLPMFRVARRSFAPSQMSGRGPARSLGCHVTDRPFQPGLLRAVRGIVHPDGGRCARCRPCPAPPAEGLLWELMKTADRRPLVSLLRALADPRSLQAFAR